MIVHKVADGLPKDKTYVLARYTGGNWRDHDDQSGVCWKVVKFQRGISVEEREALPECERKHVWRGCDEGFNNQKPYNWREFGPGTLAGQDVDMWAELPSN